MARPVARRAVAVGMSLLAAAGISTAAACSASGNLTPAPPTTAAPAHGQHAWF